ncbi:MULTISPECIES: hypothetical protein [unclassified Bartonella]|uniref:hypothetical protein n=1 Tax=unclassified Bartonella TaxID=2645622 RepID=UPI0035CEFF40
MSTALVHTEIYKTPTMDKIPASYKTIDETMTNNPLCESASSLRTQAAQKRLVAPRYPLKNTHFFHAFFS